MCLTCHEDMRKRGTLPEQVGSGLCCVPIRHLSDKELDLFAAHFLRLIVARLDVTLRDTQGLPRTVAREAEAEVEGVDFLDGGVPSIRLILHKARKKNEEQDDEQEEKKGDEEEEEEPVHLATFLSKLPRACLRTVKWGGEAAFDVPSLSEARPRPSASSSRTITARVALPTQL